MILAPGGTRFTDRPSVRILSIAIVFGTLAVPDKGAKGFLIGFLTVAALYTGLYGLERRAYRRGGEDALRRARKRIAVVGAALLGVIFVVLLSPLFV